jgi:DNA-binding NarL/FixJ family response regulator
LTSQWTLLVPGDETTNDSGRRALAGADGCVSRGRNRSGQIQLAQGKLPEPIAKQRNVSIGTVRAQIKALLAKAGVSRQVELVARLDQL